MTFFNIEYQQFNAISKVYRYVTFSNKSINFLYPKEKITNIFRRKTERDSSFLHKMRMTEEETFFSPQIH